MKIKRILFTMIVIIIGFVLQNGVFNQMTWTSIVPNILLMITCTFGFMRGRQTGILVGVVCGLLTDISLGGTFGINTLFFAYLGWFNGLFFKMFFMDYIVFPMLMIVLSDVMYGVYMYVVKILVNGRLNFGFYLSHVIIPEAIYTFAVTILLCHIILVINFKLEEKEKRSAAKFV
ncbi:MAG: rod shape-determining protein MreD [Lachnospiraceae bacterium]|nr:rod shape-determining protein MreD [Lachnospiraceae bacterium]